MNKYRTKIIDIYENNTKLPPSVKEYLKEEIDYFDNLKLWELIDEETITEDNPNNILIFFLLGKAKAPNEYRHSYSMSDPPDIDCDLESEGRDKVIEYLKEQYGEKRVLQIGTIGTIKIKSAIIDIARVLGVDPSEVYMVTTSLTNLDESATLDELKHDYPKLKEFLEKYPRIEKHLHKVLGVFRHYCLDGKSEIRMLGPDGFYWDIYIEELIDINKEDFQLIYYGAKKEYHATKNFEVACTGEAEMVEIELEDGRRITCTEDHIWLTDEGWLQVKNFTKTTKIMSMD